MSNNSQNFEQLLTGRILQNIGLALLNSPVLQRSLQSNTQTISSNTNQNQMIAKNDNEFTQYLNVCHLVLLLICYEIVFLRLLRIKPLIVKILCIQIIIHFQNQRIIIL